MGINNSLAGLHADMGENDVGVELTGSPVVDWTQRGIVGMGNKALGSATPDSWAPTNTAYKNQAVWGACVCWFVAWIGVSNSATNTGVNISEFEIWIKRISDGSWYLANTGATNPSWPGVASGVNYREESDGSRTYFFDGVKNSQGGNAIHGGTARIALTGDDIAQVYAKMDSMLVLDNPEGVNDMHLAQCFVDIGLDYWPDMSTVIGDFSPITHAPASGSSRFALVTGEKQRHQMASIDPPGDNGGYSYIGDRSVSVLSFESDMPPALTRVNARSINLMRMRR